MKKVQSYFLSLSSRPLQLLFPLIAVLSLQIKHNGEKNQVCFFFLFTSWQKWKMIFKFLYIFAAENGKPRKRWFDLVSCFLPGAFTQQGTQELSCIISRNMTLIVWVFIITVSLALFLGGNGWFVVIVIKLFFLPYQHDKLLFCDRRSSAHCWWVWSQALA